LLGKRTPILGTFACCASAMWTEVKITLATSATMIFLLMGDYYPIENRQSKI